MARKKKATGTEKIYIGVNRPCTVCYNVPGRRQPASFTFYEGRINAVPADLWGLMLAKKSSPDELSGAEHPGPVQQWLAKGIMWEIAKADAIKIHAGEVALMSPMGPLAGRSNYTPPVPHREPLTPAQQAAEAHIAAGDLSPNAFDMGEVPTSAIKPPPVPVVG